MSRQIILYQSKSSNRRHPLLVNQASTNCNLLAEVVGGTTAECAAVCCCCPCGLVSLLLLAFYKVPVGLCRRVIRNKRRQKMLKKGLTMQQSKCCSCSCSYSCYDNEHVCLNNLSEILRLQYKLDDDDYDDHEKEKEMWEKFYGAGFWRSPSQKESSF